MQKVNLPLFVVATGAVALVAPFFSQSSYASSEAFSCESVGGVPTTVVRLSDGRSQSIFHWKREILPESLKPQQSCENVTKILNKNASRQSFGFGTYKLESSNTPAACLEQTPGSCGTVLFSLPPTSNSKASLAEITRVLDGILDSNFKTPGSSSIRSGDQSASFRVTFWRMLIGG